MNTNSFELKFPPALLMLVFGFVMWLIATWFPELAYHTPIKKWLKVVIGVLGSLMIFLGVASFRMAKTTVDPTQPENATSVVQSGIYRLTRNPMYLGFLLILAAWAVGLSNIIPWFFLPLFVLYMNRFQIQAEERALLKLFGNDYQKYCNKVRRWI